MKFYNEETQNIIFKAIKYHSDAKSYLTHFLDSYEIKDKSTNKVYQGINHIISHMEGLDLKPKLSTKNKDLIDEMLLINKHLNPIIDKHKKKIRQTLTNGAVCNHGILQIAINYRREIFIKNRDPLEIAVYTTVDGQEFYIDLFENKAYTQEKIYYLENKEIVGSENNIFGIIPFIRYAPHLEKEDSVNDYSRIYGEGEKILTNLQRRFDLIAQDYYKAIRLEIDPPKEVLTDALENENDIRLLKVPNSIIKVQQQGAVRPLIRETKEIRASLQDAENRVKQDFIEHTGRTSLTQGIATQTSTSSAFVTQMKQAVMTSLKPFETEYLKFMTELVKKFAVFYSFLRGFKINFDIEDIVINKWSREVSFNEKLTITQNIPNLLATIPNVPSRIKLNQFFVESMLEEYLRETDNSEERMQLIACIFDEIEQQTKDLLNQQQQNTK